MFRKFSLLMTLVLTACTTAREATLVRGGFDDNQYVATDARLRIVSSAGISKKSIPGEVDPNRIICAEPSPDVATVIANSFGSGFVLFGTGNTTISSAHVEGLVQLGERTATIQLLRDKMYQTCLAYANGAISGTTYSFIMSRLDDTIVTLLMGEIAGGAFGRKLASVGGKADASTSATLSSLSGDIANLDERIAATTAAQEELRIAEGDLAKHKELTVTEDKKEAHNARTKELERIANDARNKRDAAERLMKDTMETATKSAAEISEIEGGGGLIITPNPLIAATLADMQAEFLLQDASSSIVTACLVEMGRKFGGQEDNSMAAAAISIYLQNMWTPDGTKIKAAEAAAIQAADDARERAKEAGAKVTAAAEGAMDVELAKAAAAEATKAAEAAEAFEATAIRAANDAREKAKEADAKVTAATEGAKDIKLARAASVEATKAVEAAEAVEVAAIQAANDTREKAKEADAKVIAAAEGTMDLELAKAASVEAAKAVEAAEAVEAVAIQAADGARERAKEADAKVTAAAEGATDIELAKAAATEAAEAVEIAEAVEAAVIQTANDAGERAKEADAKVTAAAEGATDIELVKTAAAEAAKTVEVAESVEAAAIQAARPMIAAASRGGDVDAKRVTGSVLADFCKDKLEKIISESSKLHDKFRTNKAEFRARVDERKYGAQFAAAAATANETFVAAIKKCETIKDAELRKACLNKLFHVPD